MKNLSKQTCPNNTNSLFILILIELNYVNLLQAIHFCMTLHVYLKFVNAVYCSKRSIRFQNFALLKCINLFQFVVELFYLIVKYLRNTYYLYDLEYMCTRLYTQAYMSSKLFRIISLKKLLFKKVFEQISLNKFVFIYLCLDRLLETDLSSLRIKCLKHSNRQ